jgi:hypothetical protein
MMNLKQTHLIVLVEGDVGRGIANGDAILSRRGSE